ncbi:RL5B [Hepatospora eriocheir]|uniref:RL5B n=1 Tax=Hepatospora eriocheir TaxID=1081669 RepID=A0A1X0QIZ2_9MICR|nr:RL5B [Hepatospora eriocheir]ORD99713.1 RL5B [Hepatospora eriocheir]
MSNRKGTPSYQKNYQVKRRRRREGKTDYKHRSNIIRQDVNKFGAAKSRLVVRKTNSRIICMIVKSLINGDVVQAYADSTELKNYGINFGLTNKFAAYATGLLVGRRALVSQGLDKLYEPNREIGEDREIEESEERRAYKVFLDIGLSQSSKGAKVFVAMKGASDAGLMIPHSSVKFEGFENGELDSAVLRDRIFMKPNVEYMKQLKEDDVEAYKRQFGIYVKEGIEPEQIEQLYESCLNKIIESPEKIKKEKKDYSDFKKYKVLKLSNEERKARIAAKLKEAGVKI